MLSVSTKILAAGASAALTLGAVTFASPAAAANGDLYRQRVVQIDDLDLSAPAGRDTAERRIRQAANEVCPASDLRPTIDISCRRRAIADGMAKLGAHAGATVIAVR